jgi:hypothetical protein
MREGGRKDKVPSMTKLIVAFHNFANTPKNLQQRRLFSLKSENAACIQWCSFVLDGACGCAFPFSVCFLTEAMDVVRMYRK